MVKKRFSLEEKLSLYEQFKQSGLNKCAFAEQHGVSKSAFARWVHEFDEERTIQQQAFDNILKPIVSHAEHHAAKADAQTSHDMIEIIMQNGIVVKLPILKDMRLLAEILAAVVI